MAVTETTTAVRAYGLPALGREEGTGGSGLGAEASSVGGWPLGQRITYSYDDGGRLTDAQYDSGDRYQYAYDAVGNRTVLTVTAQAVEVQETAYAYDDADRLTSVDGLDYAYDNRGNLTDDGVWTYTYNAAGRMVRAASITATMVYTYNGDGLLVAEAQDGVETRFSWDQALALPQVLATSDGERDLYGLGRIGVAQDGAWYYPQSDALGSVRQWTDPAGAVLGLQAYGPFGEALAPLGPPPAAWGYTGEWEDASELVYLRARWYDAAVGRFTQADMIAAHMAESQSLNPFTYANNAPLRYTDPSGHYVFEEDPYDRYFAAPQGEFPPMRWRGAPAATPTPWPTATATPTPFPTATAAATPSPTRCDRTSQYGYYEILLAKVLMCEQPGDEPWARRALAVAFAVVTRYDMEWDGDTDLETVLKKGWTYCYNKAKASPNPSTCNNTRWEDALNIARSAINKTAVNEWPGYYFEGDFELPGDFRWDALRRGQEAYPKKSYRVIPEYIPGVSPPGSYLIMTDIPYMWFYPTPTPTGAVP